MSDASITHIAAQDVTIGGRRQRQRCAWCGAILLDYDLSKIAVQVVEGEEPQGPSAWEPGRLVRVTGSNPKMTSMLDPTTELPDDACGNIDDEVTSQ